MKVRTYPADSGGCGFYRLRWPAAAAADQGVDVEVLEHRPVAHFQMHNNGVEHIRSIDVDADVVVMQRPQERRMAEAIPVLQRQGVAVVVEIDDDFHSLPKGHPARGGTAAGNVDLRSIVTPTPGASALPAHLRKGARVARRAVDGTGNTEVNRRWLRVACERADLVTCTTVAIAERYAPHGRAAIIPNCVPAAYLTVQREPHDGIRVGWTGSTHTHIRDLEVCGDAIPRVLEQTGAEFWAVGTGDRVAEQLGLDQPPHATGWVDLDRYPQAYANLDVAIVPLQPNRFNEAKSWLKGLEAAALGVPFVASPTTPYQLLYVEEAGLLADSPERWRDRLVALIEDDGARQALVEQGRRAAARWTVEGNSWRWVEAWEHALQHRRTQPTRKAV